MTGADQEHLSWRKSSHSGGTGGECIEVAALWRKSSYSGATSSGQCVEVAAVRPAVAVRDSKDPQGPMLSFGGSAWAAFTETVKAGHHDLA